MKAILEFNLPDEAWAHKAAVNGHNYFFVLKDVDEYCRGKLKYDDKLSSGELAYLEEVRHMIREQVPDLDDDA